MATWPGAPRSDGKPDQILDIDTFVLSMLDSRPNYFSKHEATQRAFSTVCYLFERGVRLVMDGDNWTPEGVSIASFHRLCHTRGLLAEEND